MAAAKKVFELTEQEYELLREVLNECAGGRTCQHSLNQRHHVADMHSKIRRQASRS